MLLRAQEVALRKRETENRYGVSSRDAENVVKLIVMMVIQWCIC